tara:strand:- start:697 stop:1215 length:519 start_codon:yes stop_codon:yes gene_type:complete
MAKFGNIKAIDAKGIIIPKLKEWKIENPGALYFDSGFERLCYILLEDSGFNFDYHPDQREVRPPVKAWTLSKGKSKRKLYLASVQNIRYTSDFKIYCNNGTTIFVESKGWFDDASRIRYKLFQATLGPTEMSVLVYDKENNRDLIALIDIINKEFGGSTKDNKGMSQQIHTL